MNEKIGGTPVSEFKDRWNRAKKLMQEQLDALLIPLGTNFRHLFGKPGQPTERLIAGVIPSDSDPFIICPAFEKSNILRTTPVDDIAVWEETESPYRVLERELADRGVGSTIGVDPKLWIVEVERMQNTSPQRRFKSAESVVDVLRRVKSEWEIEQLQAAAKATSEGIVATFDRLQEGMTEKDVVPILAEELGQRSGNPLSFAAVQFGPNSAIPHGMPTEKKLTRDSVVLLDVGTSVNGYQGDITMTSVFGRPPQKFEEIYDIVYEANRLAFEHDREGTIPAQLDAVARDHIKQAGYGQYFTHRLGHGIGMEVHEKPYIVGTNHEPLRAGDTHSIEPGIYLPGEFGVRIEDDAIVRKDRTDRLFDTVRYIWR